MPHKKNTRRTIYKPIQKFSKLSSLFIIIILLCSNLSFIASSISTNKVNIDNNVIEINNPEIKTEDITENYYEEKPVKKTDIVETFNKIKTSIQSFAQTIKTFSELRSGKSDRLLKFYTKYEDNETETTLRLFRQTKIDINNDNKDDIGVTYTILPGIERPLSLSINFRLKITLLQDFPDKNAYFEAYAKFVFAGILSKESKDNYVCYGYQSLEDDKTPNKCIVTYKLIPNILLRKNKVGHKVSIDPGDAEGKSKLTMIYKYVDVSTNSESSFRVEYSPAVKNTVSFSRTKNLGKTTYEINRESSSGSQVNMYCSHTENGNNTIIYAYGLPKDLTFTVQLGKDGFLDFNTYGESIEEIGFCDNLTQPVNRVWVSGIPKHFTIKWSRHLFLEGKADISIDSDGEGVSLNGYLVGPKKNIADFRFESNSALNCSISLDIINGYLEVTRSNIDLKVALSLIGINGSTFRSSFFINQIYDESFVLSFNSPSAGSGSANVTLSGKELYISELSIDLSTTKIGTISARMDELIKIKKGKIHAGFTIQRSPTELKSICRFDIVNGIQINGLAFLFNGFEVNPDDINIANNKTMWFNVTLTGKIDYKFAPDFSWGYITIYGGLNFAVNGAFEKNGKSGGVTGIVSLKTLNDGLNLSWYTTQGSRVFNINGGGVAGVSNFHLWLEDVVDISIPDFQGSITLVDANLDSGTLILDINSTGSIGEFMDFSFSTSEVFPDANFEFHISMENVTFSSRVEAHVDLSWEDGNVSNLTLDVAIGLTLSLDNFIIGFRAGENSFNLASDRFKIEGGIEFAFNMSDPAGIELNGPLAIVMTDCSVDLHIDDLNLSSPDVDFDLDDVTLNSRTYGTASISFEDFSYERLDEIYGFNPKDISPNVNFSWINITLKINASDGTLHLNTLEVGNIGPLLGKLFFSQTPEIVPMTRLTINDLFFKNGCSTIKLPILLYSYGKDPIIYEPVGMGLYFDNEFNAGYSGSHVISAKEICLIFPELNISNLAATAGLDIPFENNANSTLQACLDNILLTDGKFEFYAEFFYLPTMTPKIKINNASALDNMQIAVGFPEVAWFILNLKDPFDYLFLDVNNGFNSQTDWDNSDYVTFFEIDTKNKIIHCDFDLVFKKEFLNFMTDYLSETMNGDIDAIKFDDDIAIRFDDYTTFAADSFYIHNLIKVDSDTLQTDISLENVTMDGTIHIEAGEIYILVNGSWEKIAGGEIDFFIEPGHARLLIDEHLVLTEETIPLEDGSTVKLAGTFTADNCLLDIYWDLTTREVTLRFDADIIIEDFIFEFNQNHISLDRLNLAFNNHYQDCIIKLAENEEEEMELVLDINIKTFEVVNLDINLPNILDMSISGNIDLSLAGDVHVLKNNNVGYLRVTLDMGEVSCSGLNAGPISVGLLKLKGRGQIRMYNNGYISANGNLNYVILNNLQLSPLIGISGRVDFVTSSDIRIDFFTGAENMGLAVDVSGGKITLQEVTAALGTGTISFDDVIINAGGYFALLNGAISAEGTISSLKVVNLEANLPDQGIIINDFDVDVQLSSGITIIFDTTDGIELSGQGTAEITSLNIEAESTSGGYVNVSCGQIFIVGDPQWGTQYLSFKSNLLTVSVSYLSVSNLRIKAEGFSYNSLNLNGVIDISVPSSSLQIVTNLNNYVYVSANLNGGQINVNNFAFSVSTQQGISMAADLTSFSLSGSGDADLLFVKNEGVKLIGDASVSSINVNIGDLSLSLTGPYNGALQVDYLNAALQGSGNIIFKYDPTEGLSVVGNIETSSEITIDSLYISAPLLGIPPVTMETITVNGPSTITITTDGDNVNIACPGTSLTIGQLQISSSLVVSDFSINGIVNIGVSVNFQSVYVGVDGYVNFSDISLNYLQRSWGFGGTFNGKGTVEFPLSSQSFYILLTIDSYSYLSLLNVRGSNFPNLYFTLGEVNLNPGTYKILINEISFQGMTDFDIDIEFTSTGEITISAFELAYNNVQASMQLELYPGSFSLSISVQDLGHGQVHFDSSGTLHPTIDLIQITYNNIELFYLTSVEFTATYLDLMWDIDLLLGEPDGEGFLYIDTNDEPILSWNIRVLNGFKISSGSLRALDFDLQWGGWDPQNGKFNIPSPPTGSITITGTIELFIDNAWRQLWPIGGGGGSTPPLKPTKPSGPTSGQTGQYIGPYTTSTTDPEGDMVKYGWDFDGDGDVEKWSGLYPSGETSSMSYIYYTPGTYYVKVKAKDEHGVEGPWSDSLKVTITSGSTGVWVSPSGYSDPDNDWVNEQRAYDGSTSTYAKSTQTGVPMWVWTKYLELKVSGYYSSGDDGDYQAEASQISYINCGKIRFNAWFDSTWVDTIDINIYRYNEYYDRWEWVDLYHGSYPNNGWKEITYTGSATNPKVAAASVSFYVHQKLTGIDAALYEFEFWKIS